MDQVRQLKFTNEILKRKTELRYGVKGQKKADPNSLNLIFAAGDVLSEICETGYKLVQVRYDQPLLQEADSHVFLGQRHGNDVWAHDFTSFVQENRAKYGFRKINKALKQDYPSKEFSFCDIRKNLTGFSDAESTIAGTSRSLLLWNSDNKFCTICGNELFTEKLGWEKRCLTCERTFFPRIDPVIIVLLHNQEETLLGRSHNFPEKLYSCLAGFVEPGETFEMAAKREIKEEVGLNIKNVRYVINQPWPFPSALMIGVVAETSEKSFTLDKKEIEDAFWVNKQGLQIILKNQRMDVVAARPGTIARHLLEAWLSGDV